VGVSGKDFVAKVLGKRFGDSRYDLGLWLLGEQGTGWNAAQEDCNKNH